MKNMCLLTYLKKETIEKENRELEIEDLKDQLAEVRSGGSAYRGRQENLTKEPEVLELITLVPEPTENDDTNMGAFYYWSYAGYDCIDWNLAYMKGKQGE